MRRRIQSHLGEEPSLVPLADMLSNTVGIMLFILAFTVLVSGGVSVIKRLPMERQTDAKPLCFVCYKQRVLPLDPNLDTKLTEPLGTPTYETVDDWVRKFNEARVEDEFFDVNGFGEVYYTVWNGRQLNLTSQYSPKPGKGDTKDELRNSTSTFATVMLANDGQNKFALFFWFILTVSKSSGQPAQLLRNYIKLVRDGLRSS